MSSIKFEPSILKWAREERLGETIEALQSKLEGSDKGLTVELVRKWEEGKESPTFAEVKKLSELYKRPLAVFFLDSPPSEPGSPADLRTIGSKDNKNLSPTALLVIRRARKIQRVAGNLGEELNRRNPFAYSKYNLADDPVELASKIRTGLDIPISKQFKFRRYEDFFEYLRGKIEETGILILKSGSQDSFPVEDCRAFSFADFEPYLILVNNKDTDGAKNFSLMHEFAHILLRKAGICNNFKSFDGNKKINQLEVFCNRFAASFLVPEEQLLTHPFLKDIKQISPEVFDSTVEQLALNFKVSRFVILRRLLTFNFIKKLDYDEKSKLWLEDLHVPRKPGGVFSVKTTLLKNGKTFSSLVVEAHREKKISYSRVSEYLGLKTKHLSGFEKLLSLYGK